LKVFSRLGATQEWNESAAEWLEVWEMWSQGESVAELDWWFNIVWPTQLRWKWW